jgi:hypothetical protein
MGTVYKGCGVHLIESFHQLNSLSIRAWTIADTSPAIRRHSSAVLNSVQSVSECGFPQDPSKERLKSNDLLDCSADRKKRVES